MSKSHLPIRGLIAAAFAASAFAQSFEVASVRPALPGYDGSYSSIRNGRFIGRNESLRDLIEHAYDVMEWQILGPDWIRSERFDVMAKPPEGAPEKEFGAMMQNLLADRFKLRAHKERRERPVYALIVAKSGLKAAKAPDDGQANTNWSRNHISAQHTTMAGFAERLSRVADRPVVDRTGIPGAFNFELTFAPDPGHAKPGDSTDDSPSLFTAIEEQVGLKLEPTRAPVEFLIIDSAGKVPAEN